MEPCVLTDKEDTKEVPCRVCGRPCIVTRFAAPAKVACLEHRDRRARPQREFDRSKEPHVLTDRAETKEVPCSSCGRPCIVTRFASAARVVCNADGCRQSRPKVRRIRSSRVDGNGHTKTRTETIEVRTVELPRTVPFWPAGSDNDRQILYKLAEREVRARLHFDDLHGEYMVQRREARKRGEEPPEQPGDLVMARLDLEVAREDRNLHRKHMLQKLLDANAYEPYKEVSSEDVDRINRIQVLHELQRSGQY